jgi:aerobic C4-dicarboxylate transport protein
MAGPPSAGKAFYTLLWVQVLTAVGIDIALGCVSPTSSIAMKPLGDAFIRLFTRSFR